MTRFYDIIIIGGGPAGLAAAAAADECGKTALIIEREARLGGILKQCIHDGFGVVRFGEKLSGPEYAERYIKAVKNAKHVDVTLFSFVTRIEREQDFTVTFVDGNGVHTVCSKKLILSTGCRERTRNRIQIHGDRGAGVYTAGAAQHLVNLLGVMPAKKCVILGSGDIGLIMARRLTLEGAKVLGVYEVKPTPSGLTRNIHQCLFDFDIPLHLSTTVTRVIGSERLEGVFVSAVDENMRPVGQETYVPCDTLVLAVGLIPENELALSLNVPISGCTNGPVADQNCHTLIDGVYSCGNALHVNDLVDYVSESGEIAGRDASNANGGRTLINVETDKNFLYIVPQRIDINSALQKTVMFFRSKIDFENKKLVVRADGQIVYTKKYSRLLPPEMERVCVDFSQAQLAAGSTVSLSLEDF